MSLLPSRFQDESFSPLGPKVEKEEVKMCPFVAFEVKRHRRHESGQFINEADCRQIKGAAQPALRSARDVPEEAMPVAAPPQQDGDGWIEWKGGECPIPYAQAGKWMRRNRSGAENVALYEGRYSMRWQHSGNGADIIAYKVL